MSGVVVASMDRLPDISRKDPGLLTCADLGFSEAIAVAYDGIYRVIRVQKGAEGAVMNILCEAETPEILRQMVRAKIENRTDGEIFQRIVLRPATSLVRNTVGECVDLEEAGKYRGLTFDEQVKGQWERASIPRKPIEFPKVEPVVYIPPHHEVVEPEANGPIVETIGLKNLLVWLATGKWLRGSR